MKVQALELQIGNHIRAYCNNKMQTCIVKQIFDSGQNVITFSVSTSGHYRSSGSYVVRFQREALVNLAT